MFRRIAQQHLDLATDCTSSDGRHEIFYMKNTHSTRPVTRACGFIGLTHASHCLREESRLIFMSKLTLVIDSSDLPRSTETFLANIFSEPLSGPDSVQVKLCLEKVGFWRPAGYLFAHHVRT